jgi:hypothetical protein
MARGRRRMERGDEDEWKQPGSRFRDFQNPKILLLKSRSKPTPFGSCPVLILKIQWLPNGTLKESIRKYHGLRVYFLNMVS